VSHTVLYRLLTLHIATLPFASLSHTRQFPRTLAYAKLMIRLAGDVHNCPYCKYRKSATHSNDVVLHEFAAPVA